jgi:hypothetical protein
MGNNNVDPATAAHNQGEQDYAEHGGIAPSLLQDFFNPQYNPPSGQSEAYQAGWENAESQDTNRK